MVAPVASPEPLDAALEYAAKGWAVLPVWWPDADSPGGCGCRRATCETPGKHPIPRHGVKEATRDEATLRGWWRQYPRANVGLATGRISGFDVLDVDGDVGLREIARAHLPETPHAITGSGGRHLFFRHRPGLSNAVKFAPGLDVRTSGGLIVAPPSRHANGRPYAWDLEHHPDEVPIAEWPSELVESIVRVKTRVAGADGDGLPIPDGQRDKTLTSFAGTMRRRGMTRSEILAGLVEINRRCVPPKEYAALERIASSVSRYAPADPLVLAAAVDGREPGEEGPDEQVIPWRTVADLRRDAKANPRVWLLPDVLYFGSVVFLIGDPKVPGKTTFSVGVAARALQGLDLFGNPLPTGAAGVVWLTEETDIDLEAKLSALGVQDDANFSILTRSLMNPRPSWDEAVRLATEKCAERGAKILVIDTFYRWAAFDAKEGNDSASVLRALDHLNEAKRAGIVALLPHHASKGAALNGREGGLAGLGSVSGGGEAEVNIAIQNPRDRDHPTRRVLAIESRASGVSKLVIELRRGDPTLGTSDHYERVGDQGEVSEREIAARVVAHVLQSPGCERQEIVEALGGRAADLERALPKLAGSGRLERTGKGRKGSPHRYWPKGWKHEQEAT